MTAKPQTVALIGRQNVGKSTLFNTLIEQPKALISPLPGTTRDRNFAEVQWRGRSVMIVDTGGLEDTPVGDIHAQVRRHTEQAIADAALVCFIVDGVAGLTREDRIVAEILRKTKKPVVLVVNKLDHPRQRAEVPPEIAKLGFQNVVLVSGKNGSGTGDLMDAVVSFIPQRTVSETQEEIRLIILGKPNVGKSSLVNALVQQERVIVSHEPHTTRDAQDISLVYHGQKYRLVDTAGIRRNLGKNRKSERQETLEQLGVEQALRLLTQADIAVLVLDGTEPITSQDRRLAQEVLEAGLGLMLAVNKWDAVPDKTTSSTRIFEARFRRSLPFISWAPMLFVSAKKKIRIYDILSTSSVIHERRHERLPRSALDRFLKRSIERRKPIQARGVGRPRLMSLKQIGVAPPAFHITVGPREYLHMSYRRYLVNSLREHFQLFGTPITLTVEQQLRR